MSCSLNLKWSSQVFGHQEQKIIIILTNVTKTIWHLTFLIPKSRFRVIMVVLHIFPHKHVVPFRSVREETLYILQRAEKQNDHQMTLQLDFSRENKNWWETKSRSSVIKRTDVGGAKSFSVLQPTVPQWHEGICHQDPCCNKKRLIMKA